MQRAFQCEYGGWRLVAASDSATAAKNAVIKGLTNYYQRKVPWIEVRVRRARQYDLWAFQAKPDQVQEPELCRLPDDDAHRIAQQMLETSSSVGSLSE